MGTRTKPYTEAGLKRKKCVRCGHPASHQWNVNSCNAGVNWGFLPVCAWCDGLLNDMVLHFFKKQPRRTKK
jgi:hypothetical protein